MRGRLERVITRLKPLRDRAVSARRDVAIYTMRAVLDVSLLKYLPFKP